MRDARALHNEMNKVEWWDPHYAAGGEVGHTELCEETIKGICTHFHPNVTIMDCGCGVGHQLEKMLWNVPSAKFIGVDHSQVALDRAKKVLPQVQFVRTDLCKPSEEFLALSADFVVTFETLEHLDEPEAAIKHICERAKEGVVLGVPWMHDKPAEIFYAGHPNWFTEEELIGQLKLHCRDAHRIVPQEAWSLLVMGWK